MSNIEKFYGIGDPNDVLQALLWQYNNAESLQGIVYNQRDFLVKAETEFWCWYLFNYFRLYGADANGITIWSILLDYGIRTSSLPPQIVDVWGFGPDDVGFDQGGFGSNNQSIVNLPVEAARLALKLRYFGLVGGCTVPQINAAMNWIFGTNPDDPLSPHVWVDDNHDMTITYKLNFVPDQFVRFIFDQLDLLPRPAGVRVNWETVPTESWGFGPDDFGFDNAPFGA